MDKIKVKVLNPGVVEETKKLMTAMARLTQHGETVHSLDDFDKLYEKPASSKFIKNLAELPHPTLQKFDKINVIIIGASRRFLAQITRHQNEVKFMSASLQYSDYSDEADFVVPYALLEPGKDDLRNKYRGACEMAIDAYCSAISEDLDHDSAGYMMPQALRNVLLISATPYQWKHMIGQRVCRRNSDETRIVMLKIWEELYALSPEIFESAGPFCMNGICQEGRMCCGYPIIGASMKKTPNEILREDYPALML